MTPVSAETVHRPNTTTPYPQVQLSLESSHTQATSDCKESNLIQVVSSSSFQQISGMYGAGIRDAVVEPGFPGVGWNMHWEVWDWSLTQVLSGLLLDDLLLSCSNKFSLSPVLREVQPCGYFLGGQFSGFLWDDPDEDKWSEITWIIADQMNWWLHSGQKFISSFDLLGCCLVWPFSLRAIRHK